MKTYSTKDLRQKAIVNVCDGKRIGCAEDFEFDPCTGRILALVIPGEGGFFGFGTKSEIVIPWDKVECFGEDTVLVRINPNELRCEK